jgi:hypothetical protein
MKVTPVVFGSGVDAGVTEAEGLTELLGFGEPDVPGEG